MYVGVWVVDGIVAAIQRRQAEVCDLEHEATVDDTVGWAESTVGVDGRRVDKRHALQDNTHDCNDDNSVICKAPYIRNILPLRSE